MKKVILICFLIGAAFCCFAQNMTTFVQEEIQLQSKVLSEERVVTIYKPSSTTGPLSTIYLLDGEWNFEVTKGMIDLYDRWSRIPSNVALISIHNQGTRTWDLTPIEDDVRFPGSGGSQKFIEFIESELIPFVENEVGESSDRLLIGHSFGGLFALQTLTQNPNLFDGYLAISPSTWYGNQWLMSEENEKSLGKIGDKKFVFISSGEFDGGNVASNRKYFDWLKTVTPELDIHHNQFIGRNHFSNVLASTDEGLSKYYPGPELEPEIFDIYKEGGLTQLKTWHSGMIENYGSRFLTPSSSILNLVTSLNANQESEEAVEILEWLQHLDSENGTIYYYLGALNMKLGNGETAISHFNQALQKNIPERTKIIIRRNLEKIN